MGGLCLIVLGSVKGHLAKKAAWKGGLQMLVNGTLAAAVSYGVSMAIAGAVS
eukprot:NODE_6294_length_262_cov_69.352113_g6211_i0.p2 GENE.NODE_6294_length_262_cov_69.352113_g6211_i0~~NODE_6294_length_262_cov_69.352113_g6211_i0.p2  ORF type:complete len:62 (-),score=20.80 NODE_6294_length_262_cov_69.352113_g6211_i0:76-231(-)